MLEGNGPLSEIDRIINMAMESGLSSADLTEVLSHAIKDAGIEIDDDDSLEDVIMLLKAKGIDPLDYVLDDEDEYDDELRIQHSIDVDPEVTSAREHGIDVDVNSTNSKAIKAAYARGWTQDDVAGVLTAKMYKLELGPIEPGTSNLEMGQWLTSMGYDVTDDLSGSPTKFSDRRLKKPARHVVDAVRRNI